MSYKIPLCKHTKQKKMTVTQLPSRDAFARRRPVCLPMTQPKPLVTTTPPATLPKKFTPAFLGIAPLSPIAPSRSGSVASPTVVDARPVAALYHIRSIVEGVLDLGPPYPMVCGAVNMVLGAWHDAGCPPTAPSMG